MSELIELLSNKVVIIVSRLDIAGMNMRSILLEKHDFIETNDFEIPASWPIGEYNIHRNTKATILTISEDQIYSDYLDSFVTAELIIFASKHSAKSGKKALLVHTTGIFGPATEYGGNDNELAIAPSKILTVAYNRIKELQELNGLNEYWTGIEVTHHGPSNLKIPLIFIETGGTIDEWSDINACMVIADTISYLIEVVVNGDHNNFERDTFIGIGGTHYAARYAKILDSGKYYMGHILPKYAHDDVADSIIEELWNKTLAREKIFLIDKKGCRSANRRRFIDLIGKKGYKWKYANNLA